MQAVEYKFTINISDIRIGSSYLLLLKKNHNNKISIKIFK